MNALKVIPACVLSGALVLLSGCATYVTVSAEPDGAEILARGSGRPSYRWKNYGVAPVTFKAHYHAIQTVARWPDGVVTEPRHTSLGLTPNLHIHHDKP